MKPEDIPEFERALNNMIELLSFGKTELSANVSALWFETLAPYPMAAVSEAMKAHLRAPDTGRTLPIPADIPAPPPPEDPPMPDPDLPASQPSPPAGVSVKTLNDGTIVRSDSPEWRDECLKRHKHLLNIRGRDIATVKDYIATVRGSEGNVAAQRLKDEYAADWAERNPGRSASSHRPPA